MILILIVGHFGMIVRYNTFVDADVEDEAIPIDRKSKYMLRMAAAMA